jgi:hypothetical protein
MAQESSLRDAEIESCLAQIAEARKRLSLHLSDAASAGFLNPLDWRSWFRKYPLECTVGAAATGFLLAGGSSSPGNGPGGVLEDLTRTGLEAALRILLTSS